MKFSRLKGVVYNDVNENTKLDREDIGIEGVRLDMASGQSAATDKSGYFYFERLPIGDNEISVNLISMPAGYTSVVPLKAKILLKQNEIAEQYFIMKAQRIITGHIFEDINPYHFLQAPLLF